MSLAISEKTRSRALIGVYTIRFTSEFIYSLNTQIPFYFLKQELNVVLCFYLLYLSVDSFKFTNLLPLLCPVWCSAHLNSLFQILYLSILDCSFGFYIFQFSVETPHLVTILSIVPTVLTYLNSFLKFLDIQIRCGYTSIVSFFSWWSGTLPCCMSFLLLL